MYSGCIIKESISEELIFDCVEIDNTQLWKTNSSPKYWTAVFFHSEVTDFPERLSKAITGNWYVDMKVNNTKIIVFKDKVMQYEIGDTVGKEEICKYSRKIGIPEEQLDWPE